MKSLHPFFVVLLVHGLLYPVSFVTAQNPGEADYSRLLTNRAFVQKQIACVLDTGGCDQVGNQLKLAIPEVLGRRCRSCSSKQLENSRKVINYLRSNYQGSWSEIEAKYGAGSI